FTFNNYDGQAQRNGVSALGGNAFQHDEHHDQADMSTRDTLNPGHNTEHSHIPASRKTSKTFTTTTGQPDFTHSGIHDGTYYPDGIPPSNEKTELEPAESASGSEGAYERNEKVQDIARVLSRTMSQAPDDPFSYDEDSPLNPNGPNFSAREWVKSMYKMNQREGVQQRTAGIAFKNLNVHGFGADSDYQKTVSNIALEAVSGIKKLMGLSKPRRIDILRDFEGVVNPGEMLVVLGPPGSGCSTFLKTLTGETHGFNVDDKSYLNYQGIEAKDMNTKYRGEAIYTAEVDVHFPNMTVGDTLYFAARARAPHHIPGGLTKVQWAEANRDMIMATFGISHTINTRVGNDFIRGVSGGERKRVSIAEAALSNAPLQAWDNSTRGLDSANAVEFCKTLRLSSEFFGTTPMVAIYQAPGAAYDLFDKVIVLYEGRQIFFGATTEARAYFENLGFQCPDRQTDADFLTSMTSPQERVVREGWESRVPRSPDEFAACWKASSQRQRLLQEIDEFDRKYPFGGESQQVFAASRKAQKAKGQRTASPYTLSYAQQVKLCLWRGFRRLIGDPSLTFTQLFGNFIMALVIGSLFYNLDDGTDSFYSRGALLFFAILMNAFGSALEILTLYAQRPIVEKHSRYALYHPSAEAFASMLTDMPYKILNAIVFNLT
ncbi:putative ABC multidrug transporter, partial [Aureobasidium melanogenum]